MSAIGRSRKHMGTVTQTFDSMSNQHRTIYSGQLVWFVPRVTGGKVAARLISINIEEKTVELEITATGSNLYRKGSREFHIPFSQVFSRTVTKRLWFKPRFSFYWVDYPTAKEKAGAEWLRISQLVKDQ